MSDPKTPESNRQVTKRQCKDGGACHHECAEGRCFREETCVPLSSSGLDYEWRPKGSPLTASALDRRDNSDPRGTTTQVETRLVLTHNRNSMRAAVDVQVYSPLTRAELELLAATVVHDLLSGHARAGGEPFDDVSLLALAAKAEIPKCSICGTTEGKLHKSLYGLICAAHVKRCGHVAFLIARAVQEYAVGDVATCQTCNARLVKCEDGSWAEAKSP